jgi:hypothetical protein
MTQYRTIYNKDTGEIVRVMRMNDDMLATNLSNNPHWAYINAETLNYRQKRVDLTTLQIVDAPILPDIAEYIRSKRANLLLTSDWTQAADSPLSDAKKAEWAAYRQALRDMPATQQVNSIEEIVWPTRP